MYVELEVLLVSEIDDERCGIETATVTPPPPIQTIGLEFLRLDQTKTKQPTSMLYTLPRLISFIKQSHHLLVSINSLQQSRR